MFARPIIAVTLASVLTFASLPCSHGADITVVAKKSAKPIPSPLPKWPPSGFKGKDGVYAKVPTRKELIGLLSAKRTLQSVVKNCEEFACGAVIAAAETGCAWWEVTSKVFRAEDGSPTPVRLGSLSTYAKGSEKKAQITIFLVSSEPILPEVYLSQIRVICHRSSSDAPKPGNSYQADPTPTPTESS
jgi:hypothetical protein